jgi:uncharacterized protein YbbC (DUF1343 family)/CubicO group peptidase (beta-lactamase class C family)
LCRGLLEGLVALVCAITLCGAETAKGAKQREPVSLPQVDAIIQQAINTHQIPGAVVLVGHNGHVIYRKAFGWRSLEPRRELMTADTIFDIASLTKVVATTTCVMRLVELGQVRLNDPLMRYIPEFGVNGKQEITVRELLIHYSGLAADIDLNKVPSDYNAALQIAFQEKPVSPPGARFIYSDTNFIALAALVERVSGMSLDKYAEAHIFLPLKMVHTRFLPPASWLPKIAPTEYDERSIMLRGVVDDPRARRIGGVAGHAGLFSTADDLARFAQALLGGSKILSPLTVEKMTTPQQPPTATAVRGFGWDIDSPLSSNRGELLPVGSFGHTGWTGTSLWIDPTTRTYIIILSNSVHPRGEGNAVPLRSKVATAVAASLHLTVNEKEQLRLERITGYNEANSAARSVQVRTANVKTGLDVLEASNFDMNVFRSGGPRRIGVLTEPTYVDSQGRRTIDVLAYAPGVSLAAIFSPEHNVPSVLDDATTNVPVYAVGCGVDGERPPIEVLKTLNAVFIDIQDSGTRLNSCETAVGYFLEAAARAGIEIVILDRPNPITGSLVQGPIPDDPETDRSVNYYPVPVRHGMTIAELAKMFNFERHIGAKLTVVPLQGWLRGDWFDSTSLVWANAPPYLHSLTEATLYSGVSILESGNFSVGRGTDTPFELVGAPWVNPNQLATYLNSRQIAGVRFVATSFTPTSSSYAGQPCGGVNIIVLDRTVLNGPELGIELAAALQQLYPKEFEIDKLTEQLANSAIIDSLLAGEDPRHIAAGWRDSIDQFEQIRQEYLIYK